MKTVELSIHAREELRAATAHYLGKSPLVALDFVGEIDEMLTRIGENSDQFPAWVDDPMFRKATLPVTFPYALWFHVLDADTVEVIAVAHGAREPGYWLGR